MSQFRNKPVGAHPLDQHAQAAEEHNPEEHKPTGESLIEQWEKWLIENEHWTVVNPPWYVRQKHSVALALFIGKFEREAAAAHEGAPLNQRLHDLVRHQRSALHVAGLINNDEYAELAQDHAAVKRLEDYDGVVAVRELREAQVRLEEHDCVCPKRVIDGLRIIKCGEGYSCPRRTKLTAAVERLQKGEKS